MISPRFVLTAALAAGMLLACHAGGAEQGGGPPPAQVKLTVAQEHPVEQSASFIAEVNSRRSVQLNPQVSGYVKSIFVRAGDTVKAGQPLFQIDAARDQALLNNLNAATRAQRAALRLAQANYDRAARLAPSGVVSQQELEQSKSALESARAQVSASQSQLHAQEVQLGYYRITAPYAGTLGDIPIKVGDFVTPQTPLSAINQNTALEVNVRVPLSLAPKLGEESTIELLDDAGKVIVSGPVTFVSPTVEASTQSVLVKTFLDESKNLKTSQYVPVRIIWSKKPTLTVPALAVSRQSGQAFVFVAKNESGKGLVAEQRPVTLGQLVGNDYVVEAGLKTGDQVVVAGTQKVQHGAPLKPD